MTMTRAQAIPVLEKMLRKGIKREELGKKRISALTLAIRALRVANPRIAKTPIPVRRTA